MPLIETQTFRLTSGADVDGFLDADRRVQTELMLGKPTFLRRTTARGGDGDWIVVTIWGSGADADSARARLDDEPSHAAFMAHVDRQTFTTRRYGTLD